MAIVDRFSWGSNVMREGRLIGQQYVVAEEIDAVLATKDAQIAALRDALRSIAELPPGSRVVDARCIANNSLVDL